MGGPCTSEGNRVAIRSESELEGLKLPALPWSKELAPSLVKRGVCQSTVGGLVASGTDLPHFAVTEVKPDGKVHLRIFDGKHEYEGLQLRLPCTVFGSTLRSAHVADGTHPSIKSEHAALVFVPPDSFMVQTINGDVVMTSASAHASISETLVRERRAVVSFQLPSRVLEVGDTPGAITRQTCCFQLGKSDIVFFVDVLPSAAKVSALGTSRHLMHAFANGLKPDSARRRANHSQASADVLEVTRNSRVSPLARSTDRNLGQIEDRVASMQTWRRRCSPERERSPSLWRHDRVQRSRSRPGSPGRVRQRAPSSESGLPQRRNRKLKFVKPLRQSSRRSRSQRRCRLKQRRESSSITPEPKLRTAPRVVPRKETRKTKKVKKKRKKKQQEIIEELLQEEGSERRGEEHDKEVEGARGSSDVSLEDPPPDLDDQSMRTADDQEYEDEAEHDTSNEEQEDESDIDIEYVIRPKAVLRPGPEYLAASSSEAEVSDDLLELPQQSQTLAQKPRTTLASRRPCARIRHHRAITLGELARANCLSRALCSDRKLSKLRSRSSPIAVHMPPVIVLDS
eukprot:TRINITY_DN37014_c0_g1_i1.p1 TRINITY_DN37014_c0_g1~~TRINITY_DN37014_c0_g1_i1.p1  ORF type:complete len:569 (+),score=73.98 TRINITY_DN37014_c0_g1_i1:53-1759(+)